MKSISSSNLPEHLGINPLTGEACAYMMRILCDMNEDGVELLRDYYGLPSLAGTRESVRQFASPMNSFVYFKPSVASCMIHREAFPALIRFALFRQGYDFVIGRPDQWEATGFRKSDMEHNPGLQLYVDESSSSFKGENPARLYRNPRPRDEPGVSVGSRNIHAFTGRTL